MGGYGIYGVMVTCQNILNSLIAVSEPIINFMNESYSIFGNSYSVYDLLFGLGIPVVLGATMIKWLVGIVT